MSSSSAHSWFLSKHVVASAILLKKSFYSLFSFFGSEMGAKAKKAMKKNLKSATANKPSEGADFLVCQSS